MAVNVYLSFSMQLSTLVAYDQLILSLNSAESGNWLISDSFRSATAIPELVVDRSQRTAFLAPTH